MTTVYVETSGAPWWVQALVTGGAAVFGAMIGGAFALAPGTRQWQRDRAEAKTQASRSAAQSLRLALSTFEGGVVQWQFDGDTERLTSACNGFSQAATTQTPMLVDAEVIERVWIHVRFGYAFSGAAVANGENNNVGRQLADSLRRNADALNESLTAHIRSEALPSYRPPPARDVAAMIRWNPN